MPKHPKFFMAFNIAGSNDERQAAFEFYRRAFGAVKLSESIPPGGEDVHIMMEINGFEIMLGPGDAPAVMGNLLGCSMEFGDEDSLRAAHAVLMEDGREGETGPLASYPWAPLGGLITDKYGIQWWLTT